MYEIKVNEFREQMKVMQESLDRIEKSSMNMDRHISFIELVYEKLKSPIDYIIAMYNKLLIKS